MSDYKIHGILPALLTPFENDGKTVNESTARKLIDFQLSQGADGFYILGGTGEGLVMSKAEREKMCEIAVDEVRGRKPVICHIAAVNTDEMIELAKHAERVGADAVAATPPLFFAYDENDIYNYYKTIACSVNIPVIIYYHPSAQKDMSADLIAEIFKIDNVTGVKWSSNDFYQLMKLKDKTNGEMNIINGPDELLLAGLAAGADAGIGSTYNCMLPEFLEIYRLFNDGKPDKALRLQLKVNRVIDVVIKHKVVPSVKYMTNLMGFDSGRATYPMRQIEGKIAAELEKDLKSAGWPFNE